MKLRRLLQVTYDIQKDTVRNDLIETLIFYGLHRIQYSVFQGIIPEGDKAELLKVLQSLEISHRDTIQVLDLCEHCVKKVFVVGRDVESQGHLIL